MNIQAEFRRQYKNRVPFKVINYNGQRIYDATTRTAFVDFVDYLQREGLISERRANNATLEPRQ